MFQLQANRAALAALVAGAAAAVLAGAVAVAGSGRQTPAQPSDACSIVAPDRIVAVGDVHGAIGPYVRILQRAGVIDSRRRWAGGRTTFVQLGDVVDRGPASREVLDLIRRLEVEAPKAGGRVVYLLGNHEVMRLRGILRDAGPGEYAAFRTSESADLRDGLYQSVSGRQRAAAKAAGETFDERAYRKAFYEQYPIGVVELLRAFNPGGEYGDWLRSHGVIARINGYVFVHGGLTREAAALGCAGLDAATRAEISSGALDGPTGDRAWVSREDGPLWYRGLMDGTASPADVYAALGSLDAKAIVVAHTVPTDFRIATRFGERVIGIDTGMLGGKFYPGGVASALEIRGQTLTAIYQAERKVLVQGPGSTVSGGRHGASGMRE